MDDEDFIKTIEEKPVSMAGQSVVLFLAFPWIKWGFWSLMYILIKNDWALKKFTESTFNNIIPWYLGILVNFKENLVIFILCFLIIWTINSFMEGLKK